MFHNKEKSIQPAPLVSISREGAKNTGLEIFLNDRRNEFMLFGTEFDVPKISVHGIDEEQKIKLSSVFSELIPEFISKHSIMLKPKPQTEGMFIHYAKLYRGKKIDFLHMFKVDLKFSGNPDNITQKGDNSFYPAYRSDRLYYKSLLIPVSSFLSTEESIQDFTPLKLVEKISHQAEQEGFFTYALFDDYNPEEANNKILSSLAEIKFPFSQKVFPFFHFSYLTACFSLLDPTEKNISEAVGVIEPSIIKIMSDNNVPIEGISASDFEEDITINPEKIFFTGKYIDKFSDYLSKYSLIVNENLLLKNWRKIGIEN